MKPTATAPRLAALAVALSALVAACGGGSHHAASSTTSTPTSSSSGAGNRRSSTTGSEPVTSTSSEDTSTSASASTSASTTAGATTSTTTAGATTSTGGTGAQNLAISASVRAELVAAGAASHNLTSADYVGLRAGTTFYALDANTGTYWAGAALVPSPNSEQAQVSSQDDGAYLLFEKPSGGSWQVYNVGLAGFSGSVCPVKVPADVLGVWGWPAGSCRPASI